ncbi:MAG: RNB domain-containing ribonuclease [Rubrivivax sp.]|nr:RNB domain-containing ribonuclease [Rubrivivax sp.]
MYALFDDAGRFHAGRVLSDAETSLQIELESGKRVKVKAANVMLRFDKPAPAELIARAQALAGEIDLDLAWEFAPDVDFGFAELAREYFEPGAGPEKQAAALFRLFEAPHYFRRLGRGQFRKAPEETVKAALLAIERKRRQAEQIEAWATEIAAGRCPEPVREQLYRILFKPDKNASEYRAVVEAAKRTHRAPLELLKAAGAIESPYQFHWRRFLFEAFPRGTAFPPKLEAPRIAEPLPLAEGVQAFSIDDSATTEIDDALSVRGLGTGTVTCGIHIAAPGLAIAPDSALDKLARERLSTVYMPGWKITMLPADVVQAFTLVEGRECPAVSLYATVDEATLEVRAFETRLERVAIAANLRHDKLDALVTGEALAAVAAGTLASGAAGFPFAAELAFGWRLAQALKAARELVRGKPETFNRPDYAFRLAPPDGAAPADAAAAAAGTPSAEAIDRSAAEHAGEPTGNERVVITPRRRGAPLDLIVAEAMILANSHWGGWLAEHGVPGIYRSQASLAPGVKVRMGSKPLPHAGMGVPHYTWATSPLRRCVDLVNQWQIIAVARQGRMAALVAPFKPRDAALFALISAYEAAHAAYHDFQNGIERFWTLRWLQQNAASEIEATVIKPGLVRAETLPLVFELRGTDALPRGARVRARIAGMDLLTLDLHAVLVAALETPAAGAAAAIEAEEADAGDDDDGMAAGPLHLAIDDAEAATTAADDDAAAPAPHGAGPKAPDGPDRAGHEGTGAVRERGGPAGER